MYKPWGKGSVLYMLQHGSLFVTSFVFLMGLLFKVKGVVATSPVYNALSTVMLAMCTTFLAVWLGLMCHRIALTVVSQYPKSLVLSWYRRLCRRRFGLGAPVAITRSRSSIKSRSRLATVVQSDTDTTVLGATSDFVPGVVSSGVVRGGTASVSDGGGHCTEPREPATATATASGLKLRVRLMARPGPPAAPALSSVDDGAQSFQVINPLKRRPVLDSES